MNLAIKYLKQKEWSMGNGQCPDCCGHKPRIGWWTDTVGHTLNCKLAKALSSLKVKVVWERKNHSKEVKKFNNFFKTLNQKLIESKIK